MDRIMGVSVYVLVFLGPLRFSIHTYVYGLGELKNFLAIYIYI